MDFEIIPSPHKNAMDAHASPKLESRIKRELSRADSIAIRYALPVSSGRQETQEVADDLRQHVAAQFHAQLAPIEQFPHSFRLNSQKCSPFQVTVHKGVQGELSLRIQRYKQTRITPADIVGLLHVMLAAGKSPSGNVLFTVGGLQTRIAVERSDNKLVLPDNIDGVRVAKPRADDEDGVLVARPTCDDGILVERPVRRAASLDRSSSDDGVIVERPLKDTH